MSASPDITGQRYGRLVAIKRDGSDDNGRALWLFQCDCGNTHVAPLSQVRYGKVYGCGCSRGNPTHRMKKTRLWNIWRSMRARCGHITTGLPNYAGRGIRVCGDWQTFEGFHAWAIGHGYAENLQIDRIDNDGPYNPENCRWISQQENLQNRSNTRRYDFFGEMLTPSAAGRKYGIIANTIRRRIRLGATPEEAVMMPLKTSNQ